MRCKRILLLAAVAFNILSSMSDTGVSRSSVRPSPGSASAATVQEKKATIQEIVAAANKAIDEDDWASAESQFREAIRLDPYQELWHIQLTLSLGQQKKWKEAFTELKRVVELRALDWLLTVNEKMPDGKVAYVNTEIFSDEKQGIQRYVKAVKEHKKLDSISQDIGNKLEAFARQHQVALSYDISKFKAKPFASGKTIDLTSEFIAYYNARYPK